MTEPYLSEIRMMAFDFPPQGWAFCDGALLSVQQNQALFGLLGTTFGGDGTSTFALPDFRGRTPIHKGGGHPLGEAGGVEAHALSAAEIPGHTHALRASPLAGDAPVPGGRVPADAGGNAVYGPAASLVEMHPGSVASAGSGEAHPNRQPFLAVSFCISLRGSLPSPAST